MADNVTTSNAGSASAKSKVDEKAGTETFTITVSKDRADEALFQRQLRELQRLGGVVEQTIVGNLADLQRMGAAAVNGKKLEEGVLAPPVTDADTGQPAGKVNPQSLEDVIAPGPVALGADAAEAEFGDRVAQGDRPDKAK